jgi:hypothetical protein
MPLLGAVKISLIIFGNSLFFPQTFPVRMSRECCSKPSKLLDDWRHLIGHWPQNREIHCSFPC